MSALPTAAEIIPNSYLQNSNADSEFAAIGISYRIFSSLRQHVYFVLIVYCSFRFVLEVSVLETIYLKISPFIPNIFFVIYIKCWQNLSGFWNSFSRLNKLPVFEI